MVQSLHFLVVLVLAALFGCDEASPPGEVQPGIDLPLKQAIDGIWQDAAVGSDAEYQRLIRQAKTPAVAPLDMRTIITAWPQPRSVRGWPQQMHVGFKQGQVTVVWMGELASGEHTEPSRRGFAAALQQQGYQPLGQAQQEQLAEKLQSRANTGSSMYRRTVGDTELLVAFEAAEYAGSSKYHSGVDFTWFARRAYHGEPPTLSQAFAVLPKGMKVDYLADVFYESLGDEPILALSSGRGLKVQFVQPAKDKLIAALEQTGFEYYKEASPHRDGSTPKTWYRFSDKTYAHVIESADGQNLRFYCQPPQHEGEPIAVKPPPIHPSLRLPPEKLPILAFDELRFANAKLQQQAKLFHDLAQSIAGQDWHAQLYKDRRYSRDPRYAAYWQTSMVTSSDYLIKDRPYQGIFVSLNGTHADGQDRLNGLHVRGSFVPAEGWAASVIYSTHPTSEGEPTASLYVAVGYVRKNQPFSFDGYYRSAARSVGATARESDSFCYSFQTQLEPGDFAHALRKLYGRPETLRDELLAEIAALRRQANEQLDRQAGISLTDYRGVRSDNPPREIPLLESPPSKKIIESLREQVEAQLAEQEKNIRESYRETHAAIQWALPLATISHELIPASVEAPPPE